MPLQSIARESLNADNQSAFWHDRYTLRPAYDSLTGQALGQQQQPAAAPMAATPAGAAAAAVAASRPALPAQHDVPVFLQRQKQLILNTGKYLNVMRECRASPPRTLPLGTHLGGLGLEAVAGCCKCDARACLLPSPRSPPACPPSPRWLVRCCCTALLPQVPILLPIASAALSLCISLFTDSSSCLVICAICGTHAHICSYFASGCPSLLALNLPVCLLACLLTCRVR